MLTIAFEYYYSNISVRWTYSDLMRLVLPPGTELNPLRRRYLPGGGGKMPDPDGLDDKSLALADHIWLHGCEVDASCIDIFFGLLRKASVLKIGKLRFVGIAPLRAALALVFLILTIVQPGLFASANAANLQVFFNRKFWKN